MHASRFGWVATCVLFAVTVGCSGPRVSGYPLGPGAHPDPLALVGTWRVEAAGEEPGAVLQIGREFTLWRHCGYFFGGWRANRDGLFLTYVSSSADACFPNTGPDPTKGWWVRVTKFSVAGETRELLDADGVKVARLLPEGSVGPDLVAHEPEPAPLNEVRLRQELRPVAPLPSGLSAADHAMLIGRWVPTSDPRASRHETPYLQLSADGSWSSSDGCNGGMGAWLSGPNGDVLAVGGFSTLIGCNNLNVDGWLTQASKAGFDGSVLVLLDADGHRTGRLRRA